MHLKSNCLIGAFVDKTTLGYLKKQLEIKRSGEIVGRELSGMNSTYYFLESYIFDFLGKVTSMNVRKIDTPVIELKIFSFSHNSEIMFLF